MAQYTPHTWTMHFDDYGKPYGEYGKITNLMIQRAPVILTAAGTIQIETELNDRWLYKIEQIPEDHREGLRNGSIIFTDNEYIHSKTRAFDDLHPYPIAYEPSIILGHKVSDDRIRHQPLYDTSHGGITTSLKHIASPHVEFRRTDYKPKPTEEVQFIGGVQEDGTYKMPVFGHVLQTQTIGNGKKREDQYLIHWISGECSIHTLSELRTVKNVVYVHMKGAWD